MNISLEISYYPFDNDAITAIRKFLNMLNSEKFQISVQPMSTLIYGKYDDIMPFLTDKMKQILSEYPSVFILKLSNACPVKCNH